MGINCFLRFLTDDDMEQIMDKTYEVLETIGVRVLHEGVRDMLKDAGAKIDGNLVKIPSVLVERAISSSPKEYLLAGRSEQYDLHLGSGEVYIQGTTGAEMFLDPDTGECRHTTINDIKTWALLIDALDNIDCYAGPFPSDVPLKTREVHIARYALEFNRKPLYLQPISRKAAEYIVEMAAAVVGGRDALRKRPIVAFSSTCFTPLQFKNDDLEILLYAGEVGIPGGITTIPVAGASSPVTIAGNLVLTAAEMLAGLVIAQTANPGTPNFFTPKMMVMDMRTGVGRQGAIESAVYTSAIGQLMNKYVGVPLNLNGTATDSHLPDAQSMIERVINAALGALDGSSFMCSAGKLETANVASPVQLVIDDQIWGLLKRMIKSILVDEETMAVDVIGRVGPGGNFLADDHTLRHFREIHTPSLFSIQSRTAWEQEGGLDLNARARNRVVEILANHRPEPLDPAVTKALDKILERADSVM